MHEQADDELLAHQAADGDEAAFSELFNRYYSMIHAYAFRICLDQSLAEDVAQETFVKAAKTLGGGPFKGVLKAWLFRVARNGAIDILRRRQREGHHMEIHSHEIAEEAHPLTGLEEADRLQAALVRLTPDLRATIALVYFEGFSHSEAGAALGCAEATVSWRIFQAKQKLRHWLECAKEQA